MREVNPFIYGSIITIILQHMSNQTDGGGAVACNKPHPSTTALSQVIMELPVWRPHPQCFQAWLCWRKSSVQIKVVLGTVILCILTQALFLTSFWKFILPGCVSVPSSVAFILWYDRCLLNATEDTPFLTAQWHSTLHPKEFLWSVAIVAPVPVDHGELALVLVYFFVCLSSESPYFL